MLSSDINRIRRASNIVLLIFSIALAPTFAFWMNRREKLKKPALIPNSIWRNSAFTSICLMVLIVYGVQNSIELFSSLL